MSNERALEEIRMKLHTVDEVPENVSETVDIGIRLDLELIVINKGVIDRAEI